MGAKRKAMRLNGLAEGSERFSQFRFLIPLGRAHQLNVDRLFRLIHVVILAESFPPGCDHLNQDPPPGNFRNVANS